MLILSILILWSIIGCLVFMFYDKNTKTVFGVFLCGPLIWTIEIITHLIYVYCRGKI